MARITKPLTNSDIRKAKPKDKLYKLYDGQGLYLAIHPTGKKVWRFDYTDSNKKRQTYVIGDLDIFNLEEARRIKVKLREKLSKGESLTVSNDITFAEVYREWFDVWSAKRSKKTAKRAESQIRRFFLPKIANIPIKNVTTKDLVDILKKIDESGARELLNKTKSTLNLCFSYAISSGYLNVNPVASINNSLFSEQVKKNNRHLDKYSVYLIHDLIIKPNPGVTRACLEYSIRNLSRAGAAAGLLWSEVDFDRKIITITAERMKMKRPHIIPFSRQTEKLLMYAKENFLDNTYVFPGKQGSIYPSNLLDMLIEDGVPSTTHGFRHLASTILNESLLFHPDVIEISLAHEGKDKIRAVYNKAQYIEKRRELLQWWSDFIDKCDSEESNKKAIDNILNYHQNNEIGITPSKTPSEFRYENIVLTLSNNLIENKAKLLMLGCDSDSLMLGFYVRTEDDTATPYIININTNDVTIDRLREIIHNNIPSSYNNQDINIENVSLHIIDPSKITINKSIDIDIDFN